jgi:hypothetical protein
MPGGSSRSSSRHSSSTVFLRIQHQDTLNCHAAHNPRTCQTITSLICCVLAIFRLRGRLVGCPGATRSRCHCGRSQSHLPLHTHICRAHSGPGAWSKCQQLCRQGVSAEGVHVLMHAHQDPFYYGSQLMRQFVRECISCGYKGGQHCPAWTPDHKDFVQWLGLLCPGMCLDHCEPPSNGQTAP